MRYMLWVLVLLTALIGSASAVPLLPMEFSGSATINGNPAPVGTFITARIDDRDCGSLTLTTAGIYGGDAVFDTRLIVSGEEGDAQKIITFFVDGVKGSQTATYTPGTSVSLALAVTKDESSGGSSGSSGGGGSSSGGGSPSSGSFIPAAPVMEYSGSGSLQTDTRGAVQYATVITTTEEDAILSIDQGVLAQDRFGQPLDTVSVKSVPPADLPASDEGEPIGRALQCSPDGATFDPAIEASFTLSPEEWEQAGSGECFTVMLYNSATGTWEFLVTTIHPGTRTITAAVPHFTLIAVFVVPAEEAAVTSASLTEPTLATTPVASATTAQQAGLPFSWLTGVAALTGAGLLVCVRKRD